MARAQGKANMRLQLQAHAICCSVIVPSQSHVVALLYLLFLNNIEDIGSYAQGVALLANPHRNLEKYIKNGACIFADVYFLTVRIACVYCSICSIVVFYLKIQIKFFLFLVAIYIGACSQGGKQSSFRIPTDGRLTQEDEKVG